MVLIIGKQYKKIDFGITLSKQLSEHIVAGEFFTFFSMVGDFHNSIERDGFVYQGRAPYVLIPYGVKTSLQRFVFTRMAIGEDYTFLGKGLYEARYNENCNKIFFEGVNE